MKIASAIAFVGMIALSGVASAAALTGVSGTQSGVAGSSLVEKVHGDHRSCERGPGGWHRHNGYGERVPCNPPNYGRGYGGYDAPRHHDGYRPARRCTKDWHCVKTGPFGIEKKCFWRDLCN